MTQSALRLIHRMKEFVPISEIEEAPKGIRGLYVLYKESAEKRNFDVVYVGMATAGNGDALKGRLRRHANSNRKGDKWSHFSVFQVWDNIRNEEIVELEGLFRHIFRRDASANSLNIQKRFAKARKVKVSRFSEWTN